jgi:hypothetical protein
VAGAESVCHLWTISSARAQSALFWDVAALRASIVVSLSDRRERYASVGITPAPIGPLDGVTVIDVQQNAVELLFDGAH